MTPDGAKAHDMRPGLAREAGADRLRVLLAPRDPLVAMDLAEALAQALPGAELVVARDAGEGSSDADAARMVPEAAGDGALVALVAASPEGFADTPLGRRLAATGAAVILMGDAAEERGEAQGHAVLHRPFTDERVIEAVRAALARLQEARRPEARQPEARRPEAGLPEAPGPRR